ncbi:MAG: 30S ribosomal protein S17 [Candidatus Paceibacterota bacterium]
MRKLKGTITSDKMNKTRTVEIFRSKKHPVYSKYINLSNKVKAHDENNEYKEGDFVYIEEIKPMSKNKKWIITGLVKKADK